MGGEALRQRRRQRGAAGHREPQAREVRSVLGAVAVQRLPQRGNCGRRGRALLGDDPGEVLGLEVTAGQDHVRAVQPGCVRPAPCVGVEHRHHRQHPVSVTERESAAGGNDQRVQVDGAMAVRDALGLARRTGGVAQHRCITLVQPRPLQDRGGGIQQQVEVVDRG